MQPGFVFAILGVTLTFTTTIYYLRIPQDLSAGLSNKSSEGYWGKPNAEFDWCEFNYLSSFYVAEPVNSFSMMSFFIVVFRLQRHFRTVLRTCPHAPRLLLEIALVAAGSFAFHATLRYSMQLADELPMLALVLHTAYVLLCRPTQLVKKRTERPFLFRALCLFVVAATSGLLLTDRSQQLHNFCRGCVTYAFSAAFLYIFVAQSAAAADLDKRFPSPAVGMFGSIFSKGFGCFIVAIFGWIAENIGCSHLQNLPLGLPFPHFHGILWHLGCASGLHYLLLIAIVCDSDDQAKAAKAVKTFYVGAR